MLDDATVRILIQRAQDGDVKAKEVLVQQNLNLVRSIVQRFKNRGYDWEDLFQIGCIGLIKAIDRFDLSYQVKFSTYAVPMILGEVKRFLRDDSPIKISRQIKELVYKIQRMQEKLQANYGREPTLREIATELALAPEEVVAALEAVKTPASLYELAYQADGDPIYLMDQVKTADWQNNEFFDKLALKEVIAKLPEKERHIIVLRFFADRTQAEVAKDIGLSQVQVSRLEKQALKMLRSYIDALPSKK